MEFGTVHLRFHSLGPGGKVRLGGTELWRRAEEEETEAKRHLRTQGVPGPPGKDISPAGVGGLQALLVLSP